MRSVAPSGGHEGDDRFHRDSALGRIFHPGTRSYRERAALDSVHVAVTPDHRVSVHIDRVSPLVVRAGRRCRYSLTRALVHNAVFLVETVGRLVRRQPEVGRCELNCQIVWVDDDDDWVEPDEDGDPDTVGDPVDAGVDCGIDDSIEGGVEAIGGGEIVPA